MIKSSYMSIKELQYLRRSLICSLVLLAACSKDEEAHSLSVTPQAVEISADGGTASITVNTNIESWSINNQASDWVSLSANSGPSSEKTVVLTVDTRTTEGRAGKLIVSAGDAAPVEVTVTQPSSLFLYSISTDLPSLSFDAAAGTKSLKITTDAPHWTVSSNVEWLEFSETGGETGSTTIQVIVDENVLNNARAGVITITSDNAALKEIAVSQKAPLYPSYNSSPIPADETGMSHSAEEIAAQIKLGWNIGNTLEASGGETAWGNPKVTKELIDKVKASGFNAIRIPCSWNQHMANTTTAELKAEWLDRVKEVVKYCTDNDMYVLLNIHWDGGWLENNCTTDKQEANNAKQKAFWEQIATHLRYFDEHLLFASANEPNVENATQMNVLLSYHQTFINAVRSTGGRNSYRVLVIQGPSTDIEKTNNLMNALPADVVEDRLMAEVHYYTPYQFCLMSEDADWGKMFYYWGEGYHSATDPSRNATWGEEADVVNYFQLMKTKFVDKGIPVVLGEYAVSRRSNLTGDALTLHLASRAYYLKYVTKQARAHGLLPFYWDIGAVNGNTSSIFNRQTYAVFDQQVLDALVEGANE